MARKEIRNINKIRNITFFTGKLIMKKEKLYKGKII
jgi:hypothetical protein